MEIGVIIAIVVVVVLVVLLLVAFYLFLKLRSSRSRTRSEEPLLQDNDLSCPSRSVAISASINNNNHNKKNESEGSTAKERASIPKGGGAPRKRYKVKRQLGEGTYGAVFLALDEENKGLPVAIKVIPCEHEKDATDAIKEYEMCKSLQGHPNVVVLRDMFIDTPDQRTKKTIHGVSGLEETTVLKLLGVRCTTNSKYVCLVTEYYREGTLFDLLCEKNAMEESKIWSYCEQLLSALEYMHSHQLIHRDIKPSNVLLDANGAKVILTDFGLSRHFEKDEYVKTRTGTLQYMSPEQVARRYQSKSDVWGIGCLAYAMCSRKVTTENARIMFRDCNAKNFEESVHRELTELGYSRDLSSFILKLLQKNPNERFSAAQAVEAIQQKRNSRTCAERTAKIEEVGNEEIVPHDDVVVAVAGNSVEKEIVDCQDEIEKKEEE